ncbi:ATP-binding cassette domain-containing protein [Shouchella patagoniensis]|uniref:ATP-binding cassette domain-containing protein n=1 Tax=Shouchella patagoniensis TaxID=228576 RepID=UPI001C5797D6|nr:ATP-binding cassette domain-containing protein [Shouchella patagoniensis]
MNDKPLIQVEHLSKQYGKERALFRSRDAMKAVNDVSFYINQGETFGLIGESGSGKTTVGRMLLRLVEPSSGSIKFKGEEIVGISRLEMRNLRKQVQIVFQDSGSAFNPRKTIGTEILTPLLRLGVLNSKLEGEKAVCEMLERVGLRKDFAERYPHELSGGQRQRAGIARALVLKPAFLVLDEPVSALDVSVKAQIIELLQELQHDYKLTYLFIAHNLDLVAYFCERIAVMKKGRIVESGDTRDLFTKPKHGVTRNLLGSILTLDGHLGEVKKDVYSA